MVDIVFKETGEHFILPTPSGGSVKIDSILDDKNNENINYFLKIFKKFKFRLK